MTRDGQSPRLLIVSGTAPGKGHVGEIILRDVIAAYPGGHCAVLSTRAPKQADAALDGRYQLRVLDPSGERPASRRGQAMGAVRKLVTNLLEVRRASRRLVEEAAVLAQQLGAHKIWLVLNSAEMIAVGPLLARRLKLPLVSLVWDPPVHLLQASRFDRVTRKLLLSRFSETLALSEKVAVVSESMAEDYARNHGASTVLMRRGVEWSGPARERDQAHKDEFVIGFAGALHAKTAWNAWVAALDQVGWQLQGRRIRMRMLGASLQVKSRSSALIEYLGWRDDAEATAILARCDATYLPFPFEPKLAEMARYSFPTKLSSYIALGLPMLAHAQASSSVGRFLTAQPGVAVLCTSLDAGPILAGLEQLMREPAAHYEHACREAHERSFSRRQFLSSFATFVGCSPDALA